MATVGLAAEDGRPVDLEPRRPLAAPVTAAPPLPDWLIAAVPPGDRTPDGGAITLLAPAQGELKLTETSLIGRALASRGRIRADAWTDFDDTTRFGGQLVATTWLRAALDAEGYVWDSSAPAAPGERFGGTFYTGDANIVAQVVSHPRGTLRTGLGGAWVVDEAGEFEIGPQATIALDANLLGPATAGFEIDYGMIEDDDLFRWRAEGGWVWGLAEIRAGYDRLTLGDESRGGWFTSLMLRY